MTIIEVEGEAPPNADTLQVMFYPKPSNRSITLVDIKHVFQSGDQSVTFRDVLRAKPINPTDAVSMAKDYAEAHGLSHIYVKDLRR